MQETISELTDLAKENQLASAHIVDLIEQKIRKVSSHANREALLLSLGAICGFLALHSGFSRLLCFRSTLADSRARADGRGLPLALHHA